MDQPLAPESFREWNEQMIQRYDPEIFHHHPRGMVRWVENKRVKLVIRRLGVEPQHSVLDVGCGAGNILARLAASKRIGVDLSTFMIKRARERLGETAVLMTGDGERLPFSDASFDRVAASSLLSHVLHPDRIIAEIRRVTRPGGKVVISVCHEDKIERGLRWVRALRLGRGETLSSAARRAYNVEYHLHRFSPQRLIEVIGGALRIVSMTRVPFIFPVHWVAACDRDD